CVFGNYTVVEAPMCFENSKDMVISVLKEPFEIWMEPFTQAQSGNIFHPEYCHQPVGELLPFIFNNPVRICLVQIVCSWVIRKIRSEPVLFGDNLDVQWVNHIELTAFADLASCHSEPDISSQAVFVEIADNILPHFEQVSDMICKRGDGHRLVSVELPM